MARARVARHKQIDPFFLDLSLGDLAAGACSVSGHAVADIGLVDATGFFIPAPCQAVLRGCEIPSIVQKLFLSPAGMRGRYDHAALRRSLPESVMWLMENVRGEKGGAPRIYVTIADGCEALAEAPEETLAILEMLAGLPLEGVALAEHVLESPDH
ncbi:hypothetical protein KPL74_11330 [Bacillus sp. NP157]|nr:hypothetical protein KPL74_11330 [Bacillus sp. NP157]